MAKKIKHPEHVNHERWLVSYADFITLLFAFFTVLYATSQTDTKKVQEFVGSVERAFAFTLFDPGSNNVILDSRNGSIDSGLYDLAMAMTSMEKRMEEVIKTSDLGADVAIRNSAEGLVVTMKTLNLFESGSDILKLQAHATLKKISHELNSQPFLVRVEGHTDSQPIRGAQFPSNWDLASARAMSVLRELLQNGISPERLSTAAFAEYRPVADNRTSKGRASNRRVDIVILRQLAPGTKLNAPTLASPIPAGPLSADLRSTFGTPGAIVGRIAPKEASR